MRRMIFALFTTTFLIIGMTLTAGAQADRGNDGIDTDCNNNFFTSTAQAREYFANDGGSATRNVDDLDRNNDGIACNSGIEDVGGNGSQFPGGGGSDDGDTGSDDGGDTGSGDDGGDTGSGDDGGETAELPSTGVGTTANGTDSMLLVTALSGIAALLGFTALRARNQA